LLRKWCGVNPPSKYFIKNKKDRLRVGPFDITKDKEKKWGGRALMHGGIDQ
jgi:hypothetical protein